MDLRSLLSQCYTDMTLPTPPPVLWDGGYPEEDIRPLKSKHFILQKKLLTWRKKRMGALLVAHTHTHTHTPPMSDYTHTELRLHTHTLHTLYTHMPQRRVQFSSVAQSCPTLCDPMNPSMPGLPVHHQLPEFTQTHFYRVSDAIQPSHPLSSPSPPAPNPSQHQSLFQ